MVEDVWAASSVPDKPLRQLSALGDPKPCAFAGGRHDFRRPVGEGQWMCSAPGCTAIGVPPHARGDQEVRP